MEIIATAHLVYYDGNSISSGWERLELVVKFKRKRKMFKTKLEKIICSTYYLHNNDLHIIDRKKYNSYEEYCDFVEDFITNQDLIKEYAKDMIKEHFSKERESNNKELRKQSLQEKVREVKPIEIKVKI